MNHRKLTYILGESVSAWLVSVRLVWIQQLYFIIKSVSSYLVETKPVKLQTSHTVSGLDKPSFVKKQQRTRQFDSIHGNEMQEVDQQNTSGRCFPTSNLNSFWAYLNVKSPKANLQSSNVFFKKCANPGLFFVYFRHKQLGALAVYVFVFSNKHHYNFYKKQRKLRNQVSKITGMTTQQPST